MNRLPTTDYRLPQRKTEDRRRKTSSQGLTLVEVLVAMGIALVVGTLLLMVVVQSSGVFTDQSSKVQKGLNINEALSQVRLSIKDANAVASSYTDGTDTYTTGENQLVLKVTAIDTAGDMLEGASDYFIFFKDQSFLRFKTFPDPSSSRKQGNSILATEVTGLHFQYFNSASPPVEVSPVNAAKVRISLKLSQTSPATSEANLRND